MGRALLLALTARMTASAVLTGAAWQPRTPATLRSYLEGTWTLEKSMQYNRGGVTGTFSGITTFEPLEHATRPALLTYKEDGQATLGPEKATFQASKLLLWDFAGDLVDVYFDEARDRSADGIVEGARFFHHIDAAAAAEGPFQFEHPCLADTYRGTIHLDAPDCFRMLWHVSGPNKDGVIHNTYTRQSSRSGE